MYLSKDISISLISALALHLFLVRLLNRKILTPSSTRNIVQFRTESSHQKIMLSPAKAFAPSTAKKRQWYSGPDAGVDSKKRRDEDYDKIRNFSAAFMALETASSSLKPLDIPSAGEQLSKEEPGRGRRRWRVGSEPRDWNNREWYLGNNTVASVQDTPERHGSKSATTASTSPLDSGEDQQPFAFQFFDVSTTDHCGTHQRLAYEKSVSQHSGIGTGLSRAALGSSKVQKLDHDEW